MANLDDDQVNDLEIGIVGSGSMGAVCSALALCRGYRSS